MKGVEKKGGGGRRDFKRRRRRRRARRRSNQKQSNKKPGTEGFVFELKYFIKLKSHVSLLTLNCTGRRPLQKRPTPMAIIPIA